MIPAIIQDDRSGTVLMLGYMNRVSFQKTLKTKKVWFYSRSKKRLWMKGETSGNILKFVSAKFDCDKDAILVKARPTGPVCHNNSFSCFREKERKGKRPGPLEKPFEELYGVILSRKKFLPKGSYTVTLFQKGINKICAKVKEESGEVIQAAKKESKKRLIEESVDLLYHLFVLLAQKNIGFGKLYREIKRRRKEKKA
ncbi:bifunctional phosphoribosyl-AMP cyclohydrolase/phosphoribosyl-ATP diphosphatase HisIE [Candidatus Peregrinibacteria bacterium]|nr:bifunctional phosphoribosyl-AMP cyclohydrolase/phosphoribosyl-ATP diphosphatase HisIE [Candidatus Peregrinibacteria bacterium]